MDLHTSRQVYKRHYIGPCGLGRGARAEIDPFMGKMEDLRRDLGTN